MKNMMLIITLVLALVLPATAQEPDPRIIRKYERAGAENFFRMMHLRTLCHLTFTS